MIILHCIRASSRRSNDSSVKNIMESEDYDEELWKIEEKE